MLNIGGAFSSYKWAWIGLLVFGCAVFLFDFNIWWTNLWQNRTVFELSKTLESWKTQTRVNFVVLLKLMFVTIYYKLVFVRCQNFWMQPSSYTSVFHFYCKMANLTVRGRSQFHRVCVCKTNLLPLIYFCLLTSSPQGDQKEKTTFSNYVMKFTSLCNALFTSNAQLFRNYYTIAHVSFCLICCDMLQTCSATVWLRKYIVIFENQYFSCSGLSKSIHHVFILHLSAPNNQLPITFVAFISVIRFWLLSSTLYLSHQPLSVLWTELFAGTKYSCQWHHTFQVSLLLD